MTQESEKPEKRSKETESDIAKLVRNFILEDKSYIEKREAANRLYEESDQHLRKSKEFRDRLQKFLVMHETLLIKLYWPKDSWKNCKLCNCLQSTRWKSCYHT